jgi:hypothetical protein
MTHDVDPQHSTIRELDAFVRDTHGPAVVDVRVVAHPHTRKSLHDPAMRPRLAAAQGRCPGGRAIHKREERGVVIPFEDEGQVLEGIFISGEEDDAIGAVVAAPHPAYGGSMDSPVVHEVANAARTAGLASLRFNWRGVGGSGGVASSEFADADADYCAALTQLGESVSGAMVAAGYSFGALAAVRSAASDLRVRALLLVAPPPAMLDVDALNAFPGRVALLVGDADAIAPAAELERIVAALPRASFHAIDDADHFFAVGLADVGRLAAQCFTRFGSQP